MEEYREVEFPVWDDNKDQYYMYSNSQDSLGTTYRIITDAEAFEWAYKVYERV